MTTISNLETVALDSQVGGHPGVLTTEDGELLIKPVLPRELAFYQQMQSDEMLSVLLPYVPRFLGTLRLEGEIDESKPQEEVLENISYPFSKPNIIDIKLGTILYDDDASPEKVARMIETARDTTSLETGVRLTGFQVYDNVTGLAVNTPKSYGRSLKVAQLSEGIAKFFPIGKPATESSSESSSGLPASLLRQILPGIRDEIKEIRSIFGELELCMVGGSLLIVYEGDWDRAQEGVNRIDEEEVEDEDEDEDVDEDVDEDKIEPGNRRGPAFVVKLIDFAHTKVVQGQGPDKGVLIGIDTVLKLLDNRIAEIEYDVA